MTTMEAPSLIPAPGKYLSVPFARYCEWQAVNWHKLEPFRKSAKHGYRKMVMPEDATPSEEMGDGFHAVILEPHRLDKEYAVMPRFSGHPNSNGYKAEKQAWLSEHQGQAIISTAERSEIQAMVDAVHEHPLASKIMAGKGKNEIGIVWKDAKTGVLCKGRCDTVRRIKMGLIDLATSTPNADVIALIDFKTTCGSVRNQSMPLSESFTFERAKYAYHGQIAFYHDGLTTLDPAPVIPIIIAVENTADHDVCVFDMRPMLETGRKLYQHLMKRMQDGLRDRKWPGAAPDKFIPMFPLPSEEECKYEVQKEE